MILANSNSCIKSLRSGSVDGSTAQSKNSRNHKSHGYYSSFDKQSANSRWLSIHKHQQDKSNTIVRQGQQCNTCRVHLPYGECTNLHCAADLWTAYQYAGCTCPMDTLHHTQFTSVVEVHVPMDSIHIIILLSIMAIRQALIKGLARISLITRTIKQSMPF